MSPPPEHSTITAGDPKTLPARVLSALRRPGVCERIATSGTIRLDTLRGEEGGPVAERVLLERLPRLAVGEGEQAELRLRGVLGRGGMGEVLLAEQRSLGREVAIKSLLPRQQDADSVRALLEEAMITGRLEHPSIVPVHLVGVDDDDRPLIVMKRVEGVSWATLIATPQHPGWSSIKAGPGDRLFAHLEILLDVCRAVEYAHACGVVHRDIKPSNIMLGAFGEVYVLDWGIATSPGVQAYAHEVDEEGAGLPLGTPGFMAPEMVDGRGVIDERTDVYQLGATLHAALTGTPRHSGEDVFGVICSVVRSSPHRYGAEVPWQLAELCNKATCADPRQRYQSVGELRQEVAAFLRHRGSVALAEQAGARLEELAACLQHGPGSGASEARDLFSACRFAFEEALRQWPDNQPARAGLQRALELMIADQLDRRDLEAARSLLAALPEPRPQLSTKLEALSTEQRRERRRLASLRAFERDLDVSVGRRLRLAFFVVVTLVGSASVLIYVPLGEQPALLPLTPHSSIGMMVAVMLVLSLGSGLFRRTRLDNAINRRILALMFLAIVAMSINRLYAGFEASENHHVVAVDLLICTLATAAGAFTVNARMSVMALSFGAGSLLAMLWPAHYLALFLVSTALAFVGGGLLLLRPGAAMPDAAGDDAAGIRGDSNETGRGAPPA